MSITGARKVTDPGGMEWRVRPRWRIGPEIRFRRRRDDGGVDGLPDLGDLGAADEAAGAIVLVLGLVVLAVLAVVFVWPLLALAVELLIALILVLAGLVARIVLRRPWIVEASTPGGASRLRYRVRGYRAMRRVCAELADRLAAGDREPTVARAERV
jgi:hypothetical protein